MTASRIAFLCILIVFGTVRSSTITSAGPLYEFGTHDRSIEAKIPLTPLCKGLRSTTQCCNKLGDPSYRRSSADRDGIHFVSVWTTRIAPHYLGFFCMHMELFYELESGNPTKSWSPLIRGPELMLCGLGQVARIKAVKLLGMNDPEARKYEVISIGHCIDREPNRRHTVLEGSIDCLDAPAIFGDDPDNVIYAWFTNDEGAFHSTQWAEIRRLHRDNGQVKSEISVKRWNKMSLAYGPVSIPIGTELEIGVEFEVCILAVQGVDTVINIRLGEDKEEPQYWFE